MKTVNVKASKEYTVTIGRNLDFPEIIKTCTDSRRCVVVSDDIVWELYGDEFCNRLILSGFSVSVYIMLHGEENKTFETVAEIAESFSDFSLTGCDFAIALGGGIVGDCCGFASSIYLRGIDFIQVPTTYLAAIDSSVGGKTGVNTDYGKNLIGAFHQPVGVICDSSFLDTLPNEIFTAGACEALKYGVLRSADLFDRIENTKDNIEDIICECIKIKADVVAEDEFDCNNRKLLNLGHTFGHAIEKSTDFAISHGHAVGLGMLIIANAAQEMGLCEQGVSDRIKGKLDQFGIDTDLSRFSADELIEISLSDKKRRGRRINFVFPSSVGECFLYETDIERISDILKRGLK